MSRHTVEYCAEERPGKICLLFEVQQVWDLWSVRIAGPRFIPSNIHGSGVYVEPWERIRLGLDRGKRRQRKKYVGVQKELGVSGL